MAASRLLELEESFFHVLSSELAPTADLASMVDDGAEMNRFERIGVYANAYFLRLREVLANDYPRLAANLGDLVFENLVRSYLRSHPSRYPSVRHLGCAMSEFIKAIDKVPEWAADLALLEWTRVEMFDSPDTTIATGQELAQVPTDRWPDLILKPVAAVRVINCTWPVDQLWTGNAPYDFSRCDTAIRVWRGPDYSVRHVAMDALETRSLGRVLDGRPWAAVCDAFSELPEADAAREAAALLARWLEDGIISTLV